ncbi:hypothetical protein G7Z17_g4672 [Cylindrodendrum hubeiense]|uniref:Zn(2)-C6 fungal-type domain-containing protein n=1 Tax=Cylindrodendrum hubeiense TaxID=595255 RepID=A0A9P5LI42_9HYPO|nr:hypothetical protein G7Z17_g4672 [Cylindrodendrum hubeiense]
MSQVPAATSGGAGGSPSGPNNHATSPASLSAPASASVKKLRSCAVCRSRKVRCDKLSPCSNCRRANIACVVPSNDRPPRWARRLERVTNNAASTENAPQDVDPGARQVMERLRNLESLVKELSGQLEQANAAASSGGGSSQGNSPDADNQINAPSSTSTAVIQKHFGRLVLQDTKQSQYIGSGFWSRVSDEIDAQRLEADGSDTSEDEESPGKTPSTHELERAPSERHAFLFGHNLTASAPDLREFRPLPSQIPFLLDTFSENVNLFSQIVHMPTVSKMMRGMRGNDISSFTPANEALMFSMSYAAVTSMEEDDVMTNFGSSKAELNLKYRLGLEHALAKADFLNVPDMVLVQAFAIFLFLVRRHDSPRFVWMMTGLVIRMAQAIGLHRDGSHFEHLPPFEVEMRRRVWWVLCMLDIRASEDQGTEFTIANGSFDTKFPLNINDADIDPDTKEMPLERQAFSDMSFALVSFEMAEVVRQMMSPELRQAGPSLDVQSRLLNGLFEKLEGGYLQYSVDPGNLAYQAAVISTRLVVSKMRLLIYLPVLFASPSEHFSDEIRDKLLVAAIEVAEYNHVLNAEKNYIPWRWIFQTYTHWYAIVFLLIEISRRQWSSIVERAWVALHSCWLIPTHAKTDKNLRTWLPLRKLMSKARKHRETELERLRGNVPAIEQLEKYDSNIPTPASSGPFPPGKGEVLFQQHWRSLVVMPAEPSSRNQVSEPPAVGTSHPSIVTQEVYKPEQDPASGAGAWMQYIWADTSLEPVDLASESQGGSQGLSNTSTNPEPTVDINSQSRVASGQIEESSYTTPSSVPANGSDQFIGQGFTPWLWADADPTFDVFASVDVNMDMDEDVDWNNWLEFASGMEVNTKPDGAGGSWPTPMQ